MTEEMSQTSETQGGSKGMNPMVIGIVVLIIALGGFYALKTMGNQDSATTDMDAETMEMDETANPAGETRLNNDELGDEAPAQGETVTEEGVRVISMEGGSFYYAPNEIRAKVGETIRVEMESVDMMHDFVIDELNVKSEVAPAGETAVVEFTVTEAGEYEFYCSVGKHRENGMVGTLIVE